MEANRKTVNQKIFLCMFVRVYNTINGISKRKLVPIKDKFFKRIKFFALVYYGLYLINYQNLASKFSKLRFMTLLLLMGKTVKNY